jgi:hypothetical protein
VESWLDDSRFVFQPEVIGGKGIDSAPAACSVHFERVCHYRMNTVGEAIGQGQVSLHQVLETRFEIDS